MSELYLDPKKLPHNAPFPAGFSDMLDELIKYLGVEGLGTFSLFTSGSAEPPPENQDGPWFKYNDSGVALGWFWFNGKVWTPVLPVGKVVPFHGAIAQVPTGYKVCDGSGEYIDTIGETQTIPDLRDLFIRGAGGNHEVNTEGGSSSMLNIAVELPDDVVSHALTEPEMPKHSHKIFALDNVIVNGDATDGADLEWRRSGNSAHRTFRTTEVGGGLAHTHSLGQTVTGSGTVNPEYYALYYLIYTGT